MVLCLGQCGFQENIDVPAHGHHGDRAVDMRNTIKVFGRSKAVRTKFGTEHAVKAEGTNVVAQVAIGGRVPEAGTIDYTVGVDNTLGRWRVPRLIADMHAMALLYGHTQRHYDLADGRVLLWHDIEDQRILNGVYLLLQCDGQDTCNLCQRALDGGRGT